MKKTKAMLENENNELNQKNNELNQENTQATKKIRNLRILSVGLAAIMVSGFVLCHKGCDSCDVKTSEKNAVTTKYEPEYSISNKGQIFYVAEDGKTRYADAKDLRVVDKDGNIIKNITVKYTVIEDGKQKTKMGRVANPVDIWYDLSIDAVDYDGYEYTNNEFHKEFLLVKVDPSKVKGQTKINVDDVTVIDFVTGFSSNEEVVPYISNSVYKVSYDEYMDMVYNYICELKNKGIKVNENDVLLASVVINLVTLGNPINEETYNKIMIESGNPSFNDMMLAYYRVANAIHDPNYGKNSGSNYDRRKSGKTFDKVVTLGGLIVSPTQKKLFDKYFGMLCDMDYIDSQKELCDAVIDYGKEIFADKENGLLTSDTALAMHITHVEAADMIWSDECANLFSVISCDSEALKYGIRLYSEDTSDYKSFNTDEDYEILFDSFNGNSKSQTKTKTK